MKPNYFKLLSLLMIALFTFSACNDDDNDIVDINNANIVGRWQYTYYEEYEKEKSTGEVERESENLEKYGMYLTLHANGTFLEIDYDNDESEGTWTLSNNTLRLTYEYGGTDTYTVSELRENTLILSDKGSDSYWEWEYRYTLTRR